MLIKIREGKMAGTSLVCIRDIKELHGIKKMDSGDIYIGAGTTFSHITNDPVIQECIPVLGEAVDEVGGPQIRNIGTIGGNICNGAVSADSAPTFVFPECAASYRRRGERKDSSSERFLSGTGTGQIFKRGEILTHVIIPFKEYEGYHGNYIKYSMRRAMDIATLSCSVVSKVNQEKNILEDVRITFGVAAPVPFRCEKTEAAIKGMPVDEKLYEAVEEGVRQEISPRDSWRASREFRLQIGGEIARRALARTVELAGGDSK